MSASVESRIELALSCPGDRAMTAAIARLPLSLRCVVVARFGGELAGLARADYARSAMPGVEPELAILAARSCLVGDITIRDVARAASVSFRRAYMACDRFTMLWARHWSEAMDMIDQSVAALDERPTGTFDLVLKRPTNDQGIARRVLSGESIVVVGKDFGMSAQGVSKAALRWVRYVDPAFRSIVLTVQKDVIATWRGLPFLALAAKGIEATPA